jgi:AcrR family transcriptional regulator
MAGGRTREALLEHGALLFARHGVAGVTARQLHEAVGARNESALHYHFGGKDGLVEAILRVHLDAVERRRAALVASIAAEDRAGELRALVHALAAPMAEDLQTALGRAHLRLVAQLSHPSLAYELRSRLTEAPAGVAVLRWLGLVLADLPEPVRTERLVALRAQLIGLFGMRAQLLDDRPETGRCAPHDLFVANLIDVLLAGLAAAPSPEALAAAPVPASPTAGGNALH